MLIIAKNKLVAYDYLYIIIVNNIIVQSDVYALMIKISKYHKSNR